MGKKKQKKNKRKVECVTIPIQRISLCMIVKDEESSLGRCLESIKDEVDDIIIVDTGSEDRTVDIARRYTAKIYHHPWENSFSRARNQALKYAQGDWVFQLDADEELSDKSKGLLRECVKNQEADAFNIGILCLLNKGKSSSFHRSGYSTRCSIPVFI